MRERNEERPALPHKFCTSCGRKLEWSAKFCDFCGKAQPPVETFAPAGPSSGPDPALGPIPRTEPAAGPGPGGFNPMPGGETVPLPPEADPGFTPGPGPDPAPGPIPRTEPAAGPGPGGFNPMPGGETVPLPPEADPGFAPGPGPDPAPGPIPRTEPAAGPEPGGFNPMPEPGPNPMPGPERFNPLPGPGGFNPMPGTGPYNGYGPDPSATVPLDFQPGATVRPGELRSMTPPPPPPPKKKSRKWFVIIPIVVILGILAALAALHFYNEYQKDQEYQSQLDTGLRFLGDGDYEEAILAFEAAIDIRPRADAYLGRGDAYMGLGRYRDAQKDYETALELDPKNPEVYLALAKVYLERGREKDALNILEQGFSETGDQRLSDWLEELKRLYGGNSSLSGAVSEYLREGGTALLPGATVRLYVEVDGEPKLGRVETTDGEGRFSMTGLAAGTYELHVDAEEHIGIETTETLTDGEDAYTELFLMIPETREVSRGSTGEISARVTNALNGDAVAGATVTLRSGWNNETGRAAATAVTDQYGVFTIEDLSFGYFTAETSAEDFSPAYHNVAVLPDGFQSEWNLPMSPVLAEGETRIVLTWNEYPEDLDSHLVGSDFHVYYSDQNSYDSLGRHRVNLDLDDTTSYGPETITIYQGVDGVYTYSVHDYTNGGSTQSTKLSESGATVRVYQGAGVVAEYHIPAGVPGTTWRVFRIHEDGRIETVNTVD